MVDPVVLSRVLSQFTRSLTNTFDVGAVLARLSEATVPLLGVDGAGVMTFRDGRTEYASSSDRATEDVERAQSEAREGPCQASAERAQLVVLEDLAQPTEWPDYADTALQVGFRAVAALPLIGRDRVWGVLDLYQRQPGHFEEPVLSAAQALADIATSHLLMAGDHVEMTATLAQMSYRAQHDPLTGLPNRRLFFERLEKAMAAQDRWTPVVVMFIDLNDFKDVNDTYGHAVGDHLLVQVAERLGSATSATDTLARLGGDEFAILTDSFAPGISDADAAAQAAAQARRLRDTVDSPIELDGEDVYVSVSIGVALATDHKSAEAVLHAADQAMYRSKKRKPAAVEMDTHISNRPSSQSRTRLNRELHEALASGRDQLQIVYQPIVALRVAETEQPVRREVEALLRWNHPTRGPLAPLDYLGVAEESGLIFAIGSHVLNRACAFVERWNHSGRDSVSVNVSPAQLQSPGFAGDVLDIVNRAGIDPRWLRLEITEHTPLAADELVLTNTAAVRAAGIGLSLDDFGTGYSFLTHLRHLPIDTLKIDREFISDLGATGAEGVVDRHSRDGVVGGILAMARALELDVVAEGVETSVQLRKLQLMGCDYAQGHLLSPPLTAHELLAGHYPQTPAYPAIGALSDAFELM